MIETPVRGGLFLLPRSAQYGRQCDHQHFQAAVVFQGMKGILLIVLRAVVISILLEFANTALAGSTSAPSMLTVKETETVIHLTLPAPLLTPAWELKKTD